MKSRLHLLAFTSLLVAAPVWAQFSTADVLYWVGAGQDSSVLVVDFQNGSFDGSSYAWGFLHDGTATGETMLTAIAATDVNFSVNVAGGFLNDITYGVHAGMGGMPDYWSTWSGTGIADLDMNAGISTPLVNGAWFACSYTDFAPPLEPTEPFAAFDPFRFTANDITYWVGAGANSAVLIVDFQDGSGTSSYAWGYRFDGTTDGETMLNAIASADATFSADMAGGFLNDIEYGSQQGMGGAPNYWSTWSATNLGNWSMNMGISTVVEDGDLFGCSYTDFFPALRPAYPVPASGTTAIAEQDGTELQVYPQPATNTLFVNTGATATPVVVYNLAGRRMHEEASTLGLRSIDVGSWPAGVYVLHTVDARRTIVVQ